MPDFSRHRLNGKRTFHAPQPDRTALSKSADGRFGVGEVSRERNRAGAGQRHTPMVTRAATFNSFKRSVPRVSLASSVPSQPQPRSRSSSSYAKLASLRRCGLLSSKCVLPLSASRSSTCGLRTVSILPQAQENSSYSFLGSLSAARSQDTPSVRQRPSHQKPETDESIVLTVAIRRSGGPLLADVPPFDESLPRGGERRPSV